MAIGLQYVDQPSVKVVNVVWHDVRQVVVLRLIPYVFHWIKVRCIGRQPLHGDPRCAALEQLSHGCAMRSQSIADQNDRPTKVTMNCSQETNKVWSFRVVIKQHVIEAKSRSPGSAGQRGETRDAVVTIPSVLQWRLASWSPNATPQWLQ